MALDDPNSENTLDIPEPIDPQTVIEDFCNNPAEVGRLGKNGQHLWKLLASNKNPTTGEWEHWDRILAGDIHKKHSYRRLILAITEEYGQTDIVDACLLRDLEALRTETSGGVIHSQLPRTNIVSGTEFAVSCGLEVARLVGNPNGRVQKKIDEIPLEKIRVGFRSWNISKDTPWQIKVRTWLNILVLALGRQAHESAQVIEKAKNDFAFVAVPLINSPEYFLLIPDEGLEAIVPYLKKYKYFPHNLYGIVTDGLQADNPEIVAKLERCPKFKEIINTRTAELQTLREQEEAHRKEQEAAAAKREADRERQIEAIFISELTRFDTAISDFHTSEEVFALNILTKVHEYGSDVKVYTASLIGDGGRSPAAICSFDNLWDARCYGAHSYNDNTRLRFETVSTKWAVRKSLWLEEVSGFIAHPTAEIYRRLVDRVFPDSDMEHTLKRLNDTIERLTTPRIFQEDCEVFQLLLKKRHKLEENIEKAHIEEATTEAAEEYQRALCKYQETVQLVDSEKQRAVGEQGYYPEELEKTHIKTLVTAKSDYLKELYRIGIDMDVDAWSDVDTKDEENLAYVELAGHHSKSEETSGGGGYYSGSISLASRMTLQLRQMIAVTRTRSDRIVTVTGTEIERQRSRLQMVDWTTAHEVGHIIDVLHREGGEDDHDRYSNTIITGHLNTAAKIIRTINPAERKLFQTGLRELMEECMIDGIAYKLIQDYGTSDFEYDRHEHRLEQAARAFIAACANARYNMEVYLDVGMEKERGFKYCLVLLRLIVNAKIQLANISEFSDGTLEDISLDTQDEIMELENLYYKILIYTAGESGEVLIDTKTESDIEELFDTMFNEGLNLKFKNALSDNFKCRAS